MLPSEPELHPATPNHSPTPTAGQHIDRVDLHTILTKAGLDPKDWSPENCGTFSYPDSPTAAMRIEDFVDLCGHSSTAVTEGIYR